MSRKTELVEIIKKARGELWDINAVEEQRVAATSVGRCFKFRNSYGREEGWWLYRKALSASKGVLTMFSFEKSSAGIIEIKPKKEVWDMTDDWKEISEEEFKKAWKKLLDELHSYEGEN